MHILKDCGTLFVIYVLWTLESSQVFQHHSEHARETYALLSSIWTDLCLKLNSITFSYSYPENTLIIITLLTHAQTRQLQIITPFLFHDPHIYASLKSRWNKTTKHYQSQVKLCQEGKRKSSALQELVICTGQRCGQIQALFIYKHELQLSAELISRNFCCEIKPITKPFSSVSSSTSKI